MSTPTSATPESSRWAGINGHSTPLHGPFHSSPLVHNNLSSPVGIKHHSTPQRLCSVTPKFNRTGATPAKYYESRLLSNVRSPYQKSYTPLSATPSGTSPAFKTPIRIAGSPRLLKTPIRSRTPQSAHKFVTPQSQVTNPFEDALFSKYHESVLSPSLFHMEATPNSERASRPFRWSIDQLAVLHPADIDEMSCQDSHKSRFDREVEESAQIAINQFFEENNIVVSPWPDPNGKPVYLATPKSPKSDKSASTEGESKPATKKTQDASCQTTLTLPVGFNLEKILGEFMTYNNDEDNVQQESLSNSSLRRKLFFHVEASLSASPIKPSEENSAMQCDDVPSDFKPLPLSKGQHSEKFSSSPISFSKGIERFSDGMENLDSPEFSPIISKESGFKRSSGNLNGSFMSSPVLSRSLMRSVNLGQQNAMASPELSPIRSGGKVRSRLSLDVSPIGSPQGEREGSGSPVLKSHRYQQSPLSPVLQCENTPICPNKMSGVSPAVSTPSTVGTSKEGSSHATMATLLVTPGMEVIREDIGSPEENAGLVQNIIPFTGPAFTQPRLYMSDISMDVTGLDAEYPPHSTQIPSQSNTRDLDERSFPESRDCSMVYEETTNPGSMSHVPTSLHSQDTGYQTGSLQLTNQDTGLHTNLTSHFSSLPFKSYLDSEENEEMTDDNKVQSELPKPIIMKEKLDFFNTSVVNRQLSYQSHTKPAFTQEKLSSSKISDLLKTEVEGCALIKEGLTDEEVIAKARYILGQNINVTSAINDKTPGIPSEAQSSSLCSAWQPTCSSTPQKTQLLSSPLSSYREEQKPSDVATQILKRAEQDLLKYSQLMGKVESSS